VGSNRRKTRTQSRSAIVPSPINILQAVRVTASPNLGERVTRKPRVVTFRLDQATWDRMRELVPYTKYRNTSSFIREGIDLLLRQEDEQPSGWTAGRPRRG
jgi:hypothetical protein